MLARHCIRTVIALMVSLALLGCTEERKADSAKDPARPIQETEEEKKADERAIKGLLTQLSQGLARLDIGLLEDLWAPEATIIEGDTSFSSWAQYRDDHLKPEFALYSSEDSEWVAANAYVQIEGSIAWGHFSTFYAFTRLLDSHRLLGEGRGTIILIKIPEGWKILHLHLS